MATRPPAAVRSGAPAEPRSLSRLSEAMPSVGGSKDLDSKAGATTVGLFVLHSFIATLLHTVDSVHIVQLIIFLAIGLKVKESPFF